MTPNWPPISCPDLHRVRMALPHFAEFGWEPLILKIDPEQQEGIKDPELCRTVPAAVRTWQAGCLPLWMTGWAGLRNVGLRSYFHLARLGQRIVRDESPDVAFFSTTMFPLMTLGQTWHKRHGLPFVLDFQDPWYREERVTGSGAGGAGNSRKAAFKARLANWVAAILEPFTLRRAAHVVSVSPAYPKMLMARYPWLSQRQFTVLPFGAADCDFQYLMANNVRQRSFDPRDGMRHWVYVGVCIPRMAIALKSFFAALAGLLASRSELRNRLRVHFIGTNYAPRDRAVKTVEPLAAEEGLGDVVTEVTDRIPYFEALQCLLDADALFVPGLDDPAYAASKIFPYILARKPLLAVFHEESSVVDVLEKTRAGTLVRFQSGEAVKAVAGRIEATGWLTDPAAHAPDTDWAAFKPYTAREMTRRLCTMFDNVVEH